MSPRSAHGVLFVALFCVSTSGPFLGLARMDAYVVVFWRLAISSVLFLAWSALRGELRVPAAHAGRILRGAFLLAAHFVLWVKAFDLTDYASNLVLLVAQPVMAALLAVRLGEKRASEVWPALLLAGAGLAIIAGGDFALGPRALLGDLLCIVGGVAIALFYAATREPRAALPLGTFVGVTFALGAILVLPFAVLGPAPFVAWPARSWAWLSALVVVTTLAGHGLMNLAARHVKMFTLNLVIVLEPAIGLALGALLLGADVKVTTLFGGILLGGAVIVGLRDRQPVPVTPAE